MKTLKHLSRLTLLLLFIGVTSCSNDDNGPTPPMEEDANIVEAAQATSELSTLVAALQKADESANNDLITALSGEGPFTVFAPTDEAFETFLDGAALDDIPVDVLTNVLL
uniref:fasciclin domain-containing protein n=1 Tax=Muricauda brasiliensis TaxID=2162892 RepID=UPI0019021445